jgi:parallel beta-helix repeat protein
MSGIVLEGDSKSNQIVFNTISNNKRGIFLSEANNNTMYHNSFINNEIQIINIKSTNTWDNGYPYGGNYWGDYNGSDFFNGPFQNETGSDEIGDSQYVIDADNQDRYPLMNLLALGLCDLAVLSVMPSDAEVYAGQSVNIAVVVKNEGDTAKSFSVICTYVLEGVEYTIGTQYVTNLAPEAQTVITFTWTATDITTHILQAEVPLMAGETDPLDNSNTSPVVVKVKIIGDVNGDNRVDIQDLVLFVKAFGSYPTHPRWNPEADFNDDNKTNIADLVLLMMNFGEHHP